MFYPSLAYLVKNINHENNVATENQYKNLEQ